MERTKTYPMLCGGIFFTLLVEAMKKGQRSRTIGNDRAQLTQTKNLIELLKIMDPEYIEGPSTTLDSNVSAYKKCNLSYNSYFPFNDDVKVMAFDKSIKGQYRMVLNRMATYTSLFYDRGAKSEWLVKALMELIQKDESIPGTDVFYITPDGTPTCKANFTAISVILFPAFLLGIWHYIIMYRRDNTVGIDTYQQWNTFGNKGSTPKFTSSVGKHSELNISVEYDFKEEANKETRPVSQLSSVGLPYDYTPYLAKLTEDYEKVKTVLYDNPHPFRHFYVCNDIIRHEVVLEGGHSRSKIDYIQNINIEQLLDISNFCIITGTGGIGKSMMMRHLLLDAIENYPVTGRLPVFVTLRDYPSADMDIMDFIYERIRVRIPDYPHEEFILALGTGRLILLLDGLDEINLSIRGAFESKLDKFTSTYRENLFILSSRPYSRFQHLTRYNLLEIRPFTKIQAVKLIEKLDYDETVKAKFAKELNESLYNLHRDFTENPLLLTIMLLTYETFADIPSKIHQFYKLAYQTMAQKHDAVKEGVYKRVMRSNLTPERFEEYLSEFCALSYTKSVHKMSDLQATEFFQSVKSHIAEPSEQSLKMSEFMDDLVNGLCLMYESEGKYDFMHRSFQEYFTALFLSRQMDSALWNIGQFFEETKSLGGHDLRSDKTFLMLFDMITPKVERFILLPYMEQLLKKCDEGLGYWTFLDEIYNQIGMEGGNVREWSINEPISFLYDFISSQYGFSFHDEEIEAPCDNSYVRCYFGFGCDEDGNRGLIKYDNLSSFEEGEEPDIEGWCLLFEPLDVFTRKGAHPELFALMDDDSCPFKREYHALRRLYEKMKSDHEKPRTSLMSLFEK